MPLRVTHVSTIITGGTGRFVGLKGGGERASATSGGIGRIIEEQVWELPSRPRKLGTPVTLVAAVRREWRKGSWMAPRRGNKIQIFQTEPVPQATLEVLGLPFQAHALGSFAEGGNVDEHGNRCVGLATGVRKGGLSSLQTRLA